MKNFFPMLACIIVVALMGNQTVAYFATQTKTTNVITTGDIDVELMNLTVDENGEIKEIDSEIKNILPGDRYSQMPYVTNQGTEDFYARVYLDYEIIKNGEELPGLLEFNIDETKWKLDSDGWYRYVDIVKCGETAPDPLFTEVYFRGDMGNEYVGSDTDIILQAQCVQAEYNVNADVLDVQGWSEVEGN